jgi:acyl-CoA synthetase (AMP-forming)/AMP-acid ligase II
METPLTPLDFARRARKLYGDREAVVDGELRMTYAQFFDRIDRWSTALQQLDLRPGDRVAYLAPLRRRSTRSHHDRMNVRHFVSCYQSHFMLHQISFYDRTHIKKWAYEIYHVV